MDVEKMISAELERLTAEDPGSCGMFSIKTANKAMEDAASQPVPEQLFGNLWHEGELGCLFADSNNGKSILAVQIAAKVAKTQPVTYFDFELTEKQFQIRYTNEDGKSYRFPDKLYRVEIDPDSYQVENFEEQVISDIEQAALKTKSQVLIIDNLSYLCNTAEKGDAAGRLMMQLKALKIKHAWSILVIAHTPKRCLSNPITQNDLAGSKRLFNFFDSVFAIGRSATDEGTRYIKQLKARSTPIEYGGDNVITSVLVKDEQGLRFKMTGCTSEREHLREPYDKAGVINDVKQLSSDGFNQRSIAERLGLSLGTVNKYLKS